MNANNKGCLTFLFRNSFLGAQDECSGADASAVGMDGVSPSLFSNNPRACNKGPDALGSTQEEPVTEDCVVNMSDVGFLDSDVHLRRILFS